MMKISPMCWIFGHSRAIRIVLEHRTFGAMKKRVTTVKILCDRCGYEVPGRVRSLTHKFPASMHHVEITGDLLELVNMPSRSRGKL